MIPDIELMGKGVTDKFVYHYTKRETALERILFSGKIMLNQLKNTNDPREYKNWGVTATGGSDDMNPLWQALEFVNSNRQTKTKVLCLTMDELVNNHRVGLFRRGFARSRMWAQYGGENTGVCLIFDKSGLEAAVEKAAAKKDECYFESVAYSDQQGEITLGFDAIGESQEEINRGIDQYIQANYKAQFFTKSLDWRDEVEYRMMVYNNVAEPIFASITDNLECVVLGSDFPTVYVPLVRKLCEKFGAGVAQLHWNAGLPAITKI